MAIAYWWVHAPASLYPIVNRGEVAILFCFTFLYFTFSGPGAWSVDGRRHGRPCVTAIAATRSGFKQLSHT